MAIASPQKRRIHHRTDPPAKPTPLRALRLSAGLSLRDVGKAMGCDWSYIGKLERGQSIGSVPFIRRLLETYGMAEHARTFAIYDPTIG